MFIVGERLNTSRKKVHKAVVERDGDTILAEAKRQLAAGADMLDINAGTDVAKEAEDMVWMAELVQDATDAALAVDSANPAALEAVLKICKKPAMINSITGESDRINGVLPLVREYKTKVVALAMDDTGMPTDVDGRMKVVSDLAEMFAKDGVPLSDVYFDPLIRPVSTNQDQAPMVLKTISRIREEFPEAHVIGGASNISFGLPNRNLINRVFLAYMAQAGLDAAIIDPSEKEIVLTIAAAEAIAGADSFCMNYLMTARGES